MRLTQLTPTQVDLTVELLGYILLRLTRHFCEPDFDDWSAILSERDLKLNATDTFDAEAQWAGSLRAVVAPGVSAFNRAAATLAELGIVERLGESPIFKVVVPFDGLRSFLETRGLLTPETFEFAVYDFLGCHVQAEWGAASLEGARGPVATSVVQPDPGLLHRFQAAGLVAPSDGRLAWAPLMQACMLPVRLMEDGPRVEEVFPGLHPRRSTSTGE